MLQPASLVAMALLAESRDGGGQQVPAYVRPPFHRLHEVDAAGHRVGRVRVKNCAAFIAPLRNRGHDGTAIR